MIITNEGAFISVLQDAETNFYRTLSRIMVYLNLISLNSHSLMLCWQMSGGSASF